MRTLAALILVAALGLCLSPVAQACGGHEARAADCLDQLFGEHGGDFSSGTSSHRVTITLSSGQSHTTGSGTEDEIVEDALGWLAAHGITPTNDDCGGAGVQEIDLFENAELCG